MGWQHFCGLAILCLCLIDIRPLTVITVTWDHKENDTEEISSLRVAPNKPQTLETKRNSSGEKHLGGRWTKANHAEHWQKMQLVFPSLEQKQKVDLYLLASTWLLGVTSPGSVVIRSKLRAFSRRKFLEHKLCPKWYLAYNTHETHKFM